MGGRALRRSEKLRQIYLELRLTGVEGSPSDLLRIANAILRTFSGEDDDGDVHSAPIGARPFAHLDVDKAMEDGGWRILEFEENRHRNADDVSINQLRQIRHRARKLIGSQWHYQPPVD